MAKIGTKTEKVRLKPTTLKKLKSLAHKDGTNLQVIISQALDEYLKTHDN